MRRCLACLELACVVAALAAIAIPAAAVAAWENAWDGVAGAQLVSADYARLEQGDDSTIYAAISADGRYVALQTRARNFFADDDPDPVGRYRAGGIFRFDLRTRALEKVVDGDLFEEESNAFLRAGATNPSISADGRYVAFATAEPLVPADLNDNFDVYVRDMAVPTSSPAAFDLVSARNGSAAPATYGTPDFPFPGSEPGSGAAAGVAISADGQKVAFHTDAPSDLPAASAAEVPAGQVLLRDRAAETTTLVTGKRDTDTGAVTGEPAGGAIAAAISGDGTTVAWTGANAPAQTRFISGENQDPGFLYYLWQRQAQPPSARVTRRITGVADPDDPACASPPSFFNRTSTGPCYGPLTDPEGLLANISAQLPALSADGYTVAFMTGAGPRPLESTNPGLDVFLTDMSPGVSRKAATVELTRDTVGDPASSPAIGGIALSPDGRYLALVTSRTRFALPALRLVDPERSVPGPRELYVADLQTRELERVTRSYAGSDVDAAVLTGATLASGGSPAAFAAFAGNLFFGDANQRPDAFVATRGPDPTGGAPESGLGAGVPDATIEVLPGAPQIGVRARLGRSGSVVLTVSVPDAGGVKAVARARAGEPRKLRALATASGRAHGRGRSSVRLVLRPVRRYRQELRRRGRIRGRAMVSFVAARGGRRAAASRPIAFRLATVSKRSRGGRK